MRRSLAVLAAIASLAAVACSGGRADDAATDGAEGQLADSSTTPKLCAAVRGNGESILTHFASLSRIVDHYGVVSGMAGGSSGSITTFTYESILKNPAIGRSDRKAARIALALKSVQGYADVVGDSDEAVAVKGLASVAAKIKAEYDAKGIAALSPSEAAEAAKRLEEVLSVPEIRELVNPEIFAMLADVPHLSFNVAEIKTSIEQLGAFSVDDNRLFFRSGILSWPALATFFGRVGDFYAGYGPSDSAGMSAWMDACAETTRDMPWSETSRVDAGGGETCGAMFAKLVTDFRAKVRTAPAGSYASRIDERVGDPRSPLHKLVSTAVLEGDAVTAYETARAKYVAGAYPTGDVAFAPSFDDVAFGYWGSDADVAKVAANPKHFDDLKTKKMTSLGNATWREILAASPAEPGLSRFVRLSDGRYSAGGWSDLAPALVLKNLGCEHVVYVTRTGDESQFAAKIAMKAGMSESEWRALYDLSNEESSYARSVATSDAVWCTRWNDFKDSEMSAEVLDAYDAPLETRPSFASKKPLRPYANVTDRTDRVGCTPGLSGGATYPK